MKTFQFFIVLTTINPTQEYLIDTIYHILKEPVNLALMYDVSKIIYRMNLFVLAEGVVLLIYYLADYHFESGQDNLYQSLSQHSIAEEQRQTLMEEAITPTPEAPLIRK